ncbi:hypothetical protein NC652_021152 [Populus alba x Populus x berolinensis]|nr:hypothetical protein NC652_021152 [Populus alba x Populus x berolinensis]
MLSTAAHIFLMCPIESESVSWSKSKSPHPVTGHQLLVLVLDLTAPGEIGQKFRAYCVQRESLAGPFWAQLELAQTTFRRMIPFRFYPCLLLSYVFYQIHTMRCLQNSSVLGYCHVLLIIYHYMLD